MNRQIKWAAIQPLTGGMYLGAEEAIGHKAEWIMSFKGLDTVKYSKTDPEKMTSVGNEYNLLKYLEKNGRSVPYYVINSAMFDIDIDNTNVDITLDGNKELPDYHDIDIVVGVPVCSGLSMVTSGSDETKMKRNCNMQWMANYTLEVIRPKIYIFENAPTLMTERGDYLREWFNELAEIKGYSILYYKTDTILHNNPQKRPRTFVIFVKHNKYEPAQDPPLFEWENQPISLEDFLNNIPEGLEQDEPVPTGVNNYYLRDFIDEEYDHDWKKLVSGSVMNFIIKEKKLDKLIEHTENNDKYGDENKKKTLKYFNHIKLKKSMGLNFYGNDLVYYKDKLPSVQFRAIPNMVHITKNRVYTIREYLSFMGMPYDFILYGDSTNLPKIAQNVPVGTAKFIVQQAMKVIENWDKERTTNHNALYQNNIEQKTRNGE